MNKKIRKDSDEKESRKQEDVLTETFRIQMAKMNQAAEVEEKMIAQYRLATQALGKRNSKKMNTDEIAEAIKQYAGHGMKCPVCGGLPHQTWTGEFGGGEYVVRHSCSCIPGRHHVGYKFIGATNDSSEYDCGAPRCPQCAEESNGYIKERYVDGGVLIVLTCSKCDGEWYEFYQYTDVTLDLEHGVMSCDCNGNVSYSPDEPVTTNVNTDILAA